MHDIEQGRDDLDSYEEESKDAPLRILVIYSSDKGKDKDAELEETKEEFEENKTFTESRTYIFNLRYGEAADVKTFRFLIWLIVAYRYN